MKRCWPWAHEYKLDLADSERINESALYTFGSKVYRCRKCNKPKVVWPPNVY